MADAALKSPLDLDRLQFKEQVVACGGRQLWDMLITGRSCATTQELAHVLAGLICVIDRGAKDSGSLMHEAQHDTTVMLALTLCRLLAFTPTHAWQEDHELLEAHKRRLIEEALARYELDTQRQLGRRPS